MADTVTEDWTSKTADQVASAWGYSAGKAKWWRSSASHVFVVPSPDGRRYLRLTPSNYREIDAVDAVVRLMSGLRGKGAPVVAPVPAADGCLAVTVETDCGLMHAMLVEAAPGEEVSPDELTPLQARQWGLALARIHRDATEGGVGPTEQFAELSAIPDLVADDPVLAGATRRLADAVSTIPRDEHTWGVVHGDFELDNMAWEHDSPTAFDFDEAAQSWFAADVAYAVRDLTDQTGAPADQYQEIFDAFVAGYRLCRPLKDSELALLPLFTGAHAARSLVRIRQAAGAADENEESWLVNLRAKLAALSEEHRSVVINVARQWD